MIVSHATALGALEWIPDGEAGTWATLARMRTLAREGAKDPVVRATAERIVRDAGASPGSLAALAALHRFVADRIGYERDPAGIEQLTTPRRTLEKRREDCDGKATLLAALLAAVSHPARVAFRAISTDWRTPRRFTHVFNVARLAGRVIPMDATYPGTQLGWQYPRAVQQVELACS